MKSHSFTPDDLAELHQAEIAAMNQERKQLNFAIVKQPEETGRRLKFRVIAQNKFTATELARHNSALQLLEIVVNSKEYKDWVLNQFFSNTRKSPEDIYDIQMTGQTTLDPDKDYALDIDVTMYEENNSTVGYTYGNTFKTWVNRKFFKNYSLGEIAGNAWHEGNHKYGFDHASASDHQSVPYKCGYKVRDMITAYEAGKRYVDLYPEAPVNPERPGAPTPVLVPPVSTKKKVCKRVWYTLWLKQVCWYE